MEEKEKTRNAKLMQIKGSEKATAKKMFGKFLEKEKLTQAADLIPLAKDSAGFMKLLNELNVKSANLSSPAGSVPKKDQKSN